MAGVPRESSEEVTGESRTRTWRRQARTASRQGYSKVVLTMGLALRVRLALTIQKSLW